MCIRFDFINDLTYLLHFYFSENAKVRKNVTAQKLDFQQVLANQLLKLRSFNVKRLVEESLVL